MGVWKSLAGTVRVRITSAVPADILTAINNAGILFYDITAKDDLTLVGNIYIQEYLRLKNILHKQGGKIEIVKIAGIYWTVKGLLSRPVLIAGLCLIFFLTLYLPTRVLFIAVEGNSSVSDTLIIDKAKNAGIMFGSSRKAGRSEQVKNTLLGEIPQLQWVGVNTYGCLAVISVRERTAVPKMDENKCVGSIVSVRDGIVETCTVVRGTSLCKPGSAVKAGQVLISGYTDCGILIQATCAEGEVVAKTYWESEQVTPLINQKRGSLVKEKTKISILFGKNLINLWKDSGISDTRCVKMYEKKYLTLPGGFQLPFAVIRERCFYYSLESTAPDENAYQWLQDYSARYLKSQMIAGEILSADQELHFTDTICILQGKYHCREMIGRVRYEETINYNGDYS